MQSFGTRVVVGLAALLGLGLGAGCGEEGPGGIGPSFKELAKECGLACPGDKDNMNEVVKGVAEGNAAISGVASVDAFFAAVVNFNNAAASVSGAIDAQLQAIKADFELDAATNAEIAAKLDAKLKASLDGDLKLKISPAKCAVDAQASVEASARCEGKASPGKVEVECKGSCEAEVGAKLDCGAEAELKCTFTDPSFACGGSCNGECHLEVDAQGKCEGTCEGKCNGECSLQNGDGSCAGECSGKCEGTCKARLSASATCQGKCEGECTATPPDGECSANARASCEGSASASVMCSGRCDGEVTPPSVKAECEASAKAEASVNVQCTPPTIEVSYKLAAGLQGEANADARAKFEVALKNLVKLRLPALLQAAARAEFVAKAGEGLGVAAKGAVKGAIDGSIKGGVNARAAFGLTCALGQLDAVGSVVQSSTAKLTGSLNAVVSLKGVLKI